MESNDAELEQRIAKWESELIDLSLRNSLLNYRPTKTSSLVVKEPGPKKIFDDLVRENDTLGVISEKFRDDFRETNVGSRDCELYNYVALNRVKEAPSTLNPYTEKVLNHLRNRSRMYQRERGVESLFICFGSLVWREELRPDQTLIAPLLLVPIRLTKGGLIAPHSIRMMGEDVMLNPALAVKVRKEVNLELPLPPDDLKDFDVMNYLETVSQLLTKRQGWVAQVGQPIISLFTFAKTVIYNDMRQNHEAIKRHPLIQSLAGPRTGSRPPLEDRAVVEVEPLQSYLILESDASQQEAVQAVRAGQSMVLIGPPGTGKSQTITNIIAETMAAGKTVLFVSEKMAALEVVKRRLDNCGLGEFCLELHSTTPKKEDVLKAIEEAKKGLTAPPGLIEEYKLNQLRSVRDDLAAYATALHKRSGAIERAAYDAYSELSTLHDQRQLIFDVPNPMAIGAESLAKAEMAAQRLAALRNVIAMKDSHPWRDCDLRDLGPAQQAELLTGLEDVQEDIGDLDTALSKFLFTVNMSSPPTLDAMRRCLSLLMMVSSSPRPPRHWFERNELSRLIDVANRLRTAGSDVTLNESRLLSKYRREVLDFDGRAYAERFEREYAGGLRILRSGYRKDMHVLDSLSQKGKLGYDDVLNDMRALRSYQAARTLLAEASVKGTEWFGRYYQGNATDFDALLKDLRWTEAFINSAGYFDAWTAVAAESSSTLDLARTCQNDARAALDSLEKALASVRKAFNDDLRWIDGSTEMVKLKDFAARHLEARSKLSEWMDFLNAQRTFREQGLGQFLDEILRRQPDQSDLDALFRKRFWQLWLEEMYRTEPVLSRFNSAEQAERIKRFQALDREQMVMARERLKLLLRDRLRRKLTEPMPEQTGEKKKRSFTIRELLVARSHDLQSLKPCFLMSPISVSQFLLPPDQGGPMFDLVIFDEASQVVPEDAICCIMRGQQLVVVGDNKQLPPTRFFDRLSIDPLDEEEDQDLESILDECIETGLQQRMLEWHYRSRQESLIAFSNYHLYGNRLKTFPAADQGRKDDGIELVHVKDGLYDRGGKRDNRNEAARVVDLVIQLHLTEPERTMGVVAFSQAQQDAIQDILDYRIKVAARDRPELERLYDDDVPEPFFIKNLENVQGDERDLMIFSVGYGRDEKGEMTMNFGPLNQQGGARRLNVAITRARKGIKVVSSIRSDDIKVNDSSPTGVRLLRDYLDYAEARGERVALTPQDADRSRERLEESIAYALVTRGHLAVRRVGSSAIRVDVAVKHPTEQGKYILGILCDGPSYRECQTTRDREVTRENVLDGLGWKLVRVWSRDWVMDRDKVLDHLDRTIKDTLSSAPAKKEK